VQLKYHQKTYEILTQRAIDATPFVEAETQHFDAILRAELNITPDAELTRTRWANRKRRSIAWTELELYQRPIQFSQANQNAIRDFERNFGISLPASVKEWYSLDIAPEIMGSASYGWASIDEMSPLKDNTCYFLYAEYFDQVGEQFYFQLGSGDDPPVLADTSGKKVVEPTFSQFIYCHFWDWLSPIHYPYHVEVRHVAFSGAPTSHKIPDRYFVPILHLQGLYTEIPSHYRQRFYNAHVQMWVSTVDKQDDRFVTGGHFRANSLRDLETMIDEIWQGNAPLFRMSQWEGMEQLIVDTMLNRKKLGLILQVLQNADDWMTADELATELGSPINRMYPEMNAIVTSLVEIGKVNVEKTSQGLIYRINR
jgi:hypothetical protein